MLTAIWDQLTEDLNRQEEINAEFQEEMKAKIEAAKNDELLATVQKISARLAQIEEKLEEKDAIKEEGK